ncbi:hypothetical protein C1Y30_03635 [Pseudomonas sp. GW704-F3]|nr:hypothetical protein C1Y30_03635 [Pseudomonas sp. GW704-F3]PMU96423.1 hypothetical protein C1Y28_06770 [Pseudomonas sp. GW704-F5]PMV08051.1 hypothetical protein C1Y29_02530 [Pseudomonas sp. MPBD4-3]PMV36068.1 hypothetical protein C1Y27_00430 [Pseudomonas sp. GW704-F2]
MFVLNFDWNTFLYPPLGRLSSIWQHFLAFMISSDIFTAFGIAGRNRPILLKKSVSVFTTEKYTSEIEIPVLSRGCWIRISRSRVKK